MNGFEKIVLNEIEFDIIVFYFRFSFFFFFLKFKSNFDQDHVPISRIFFSSCYYSKNRKIKLQILKSRVSRIIKT